MIIIFVLFHHVLSHILAVSAENHIYLTAGTKGMPQGGIIRVPAHLGGKNETKDMDI